MSDHIAELVIAAVVVVIGNILLTWRQIAESRRQGAAIAGMGKTTHEIHVAVNSHAAALKDLNDRAIADLERQVAELQAQIDRLEPATPVATVSSTAVTPMREVTPHAGVE
jgi:GH35 family endo-1,4-beta-xylanase